MSRHLLYILAENRPRVLARISVLCAHKNINIVGISAGTDEGSLYGSLTLQVDTPGGVEIEFVIKQLTRIVNVVRIVELTNEYAHRRKLIMVKVDANANVRGEVLDIARAFGAEVVEVTLSTVTLQFASVPPRITEFLVVLGPYSIRELVDSGTIALRKGSRSAEGGRRSPETWPFGGATDV